MNFLKPRFKNNIKPILQLSETECGIAALAMLLAYYRVNIPIDVLRTQCGASRDGCKASTLIAVAKEYGFQADGYKVELEDIAALGKPVIAFWNFNHYVVICGADSKNIYINDPAQGRLTISFTEFDQAFTGIVLAITPTTQVQPIKSPFPIKTYFQEWFWQFKGEWLFIVLISLLYMCGPVLNSLLSSIFINYCVIGANRHWLSWLAVFALVIAISLMLITVIQQGYQFKITTKASLLKTSALLIHTLKLPLLYFSLRQKGEIIVILARAETVINSFFNNLTGVAVNICMAACCLSVMLIISISLTVKLLAIATIFTLLIAYLSKSNLAHEKKHIITESKLYAFAMASLRNIETIKACALEPEILSKWHKLFCKNLQTRDQLNVITAKITSLNQLANWLSLAIIMFYGSNLVTEGGISVGNLLAYYGLVILFYKNTETIVVSYQQAQKAYAAHLQVNDLKITQADPRFNAMQMPLVAHHNEPLLCCKNVNFYYNKRAAPVLKNINLNINTGQQIALVGTTGSGKSSLAKLLCGSYAPDQGNILLAGTNICSFSATDFYKNFAYVSQEIALFSGTLYENITLGHEKLSLHKINCALQQAGLQELIAQRGLHALVTENGDNFSGGEKQRLEIARALLLDTPILILDEATSALDLITEATIIDNLRRLSKTIIYVAHRLSTIQHCDVIYVLEHGRIIEQGSHQQLLQRQQRYFQLTQEEGSLNVC